MQFERQKLRSTNAVRKTKTSIYLMQFERQKLRSTKCSSKDENFDLLFDVTGHVVLHLSAKVSDVSGNQSDYALQCIVFET